MRVAAAAVLALALTGCMPTQVGSIYPRLGASRESSRDIWVTIDGTGNNQTSRTNAARLYEMVDARSGQRVERGLATYYAEGVGSTKGDLAGLALGMGMSEDVRNAYEFLTRTQYRAGDRIFLSGFSRGAYGVRVLNGLIAIAGVPDLSNVPAAQRGKLVSRIFRAYKTSRRPDESLQEHNARRLEAIRELLAPLGIPLVGENGSTRIEAMTIWDTVEALGWPDGTEDPAENLTHYYITSCNVNHVFHALALDDNRAYSFTPIFADSPLMREGCENSSQHVEEVWFAGAHADVGGSYAPHDLTDGYLPGVSLNWMLRRLAPFGLLDDESRVHADPLGPIHDAKAATLAYKLLYRNFREPLRYHGSVQAGGRPKVHFTAFDRLARAKELDRTTPQCPRGARLGDRPLLLCGSDLKLFGFLDEMLVSGCMVETEAGFNLVTGQTCVSVVCEVDSQSPYCRPPHHFELPGDKRPEPTG